MILGVFGFAVALAAIIEGLVEIAAKVYDVVTGGKVRALVLTLVPILAGIGLAFAANLHLLGFVADLFEQSINPVVDVVLSGLVIGRGSSYVHDLWKRVQGLSGKDEPGD